MRLVGRLLAAAAIAAAVFSVRDAFAQTGRAPELVPPAPEGSTDVPYPVDGNGDAYVVLEIVVEKDGTVSRADVVDGAPPFAEHARRAVLDWHFVPARRGGVPVAVRTRARVEFRQVIEPPATTAPAKPASPASNARATPDADADSDEVTVRGRRREIGRMILSAEDVRQMPGAFGDPFRAVDALPGVVPVLSGLPYFFIRGAPPNNAGYFVDGVRVPLLFHIGLGPGVIHPELIERVDFHPGAAPAEYGLFAGPIITGVTRAPSARARGAANLRLVDAGALVESPFAGERGSALVAGRYGYPGPILSAVSDVTLDYWDYQSRVAWRCGERDTLSLFAFGSHDKLAHVDRTGATVEDFASDFHRIDLRFDRKSSAGHARVAATFGYDAQGASPTYLSNWSGALRAQIERPIAGGLRVRGGADARIDAYAFEQGAPISPGEPIVPSGVDPPPTNVVWGGHADVVWPVTPRFEIVPGARVDVFESTRRSSAHVRVPAFDPRLAARLKLTRSVAFVSAFGLAHQYPTLRIGSLPAAVAGGLGFPKGSSRLQRVAQASQGVEVALPADVTMTTSVFLSGWSGLTDLTSGCIQIEPPVVGPPPPLEPGETPGERRISPPYVCPNEGPVHGRAYGAELLVRRALTKRLGGWLSYTLSRATREARFVRLDGGTSTATVPSDFDRTHVLNAVLTYDLGRRWRAGGRFTVYSGAPFSRLEGSVPVPPYNAQRDPPFLRVDARIEKRWPFAKDGSIAFVIEGQNLTLSKERSSLGIDCIGRMSPEGGTNECRRAEIGPISIASVGVEAFF